MYVRDNGQHCVHISLIWKCLSLTLCCSKAVEWTGLHTASIEAVDSQDVHTAHLGGPPNLHVGVGNGNNGRLPICREGIPENQTLYLCHWVKHPLQCMMFHYHSLWWFDTGVSILHGTFSNPLSLSITLSLYHWQIHTHNTHTQKERECVYVFLKVSAAQSWPSIMHDRAIIIRGSKVVGVNLVEVVLLS